MPIHSLADWLTPETVLAALERGTTFKTEVMKPGAAGPVYLHPGDEECDLCGATITEEDFPGANLGNVLANQKYKYGGTACRSHLETLKDQAPEGDWYERREHF